MAEKDKKPEMEDTTQSTSVASHAKPNASTMRVRRRQWLIGGGIALGVLAAFVVGALAADARNHSILNRFGDYDSDGDRAGRPGMMMDRSRDGVQGGGMMRGVSTYDSNTMVTGVVTEVSDADMTIIGNGVSKKVVINASTTYGTNKPKVKDSVMVRGTTSGETFTATSVQVVNR